MSHYCTCGRFCTNDEAPGEYWIGQSSTVKSIVRYQRGAYQLGDGSARTAPVVPPLIVPAGCTVRCDGAEVVVTDAAGNEVGRSALGPVS